MSWFTSQKQDEDHRIAMEYEYNKRLMDSMQKTLIAQLGNAGYGDCQQLIIEICKNPNTIGLLKLPFDTTDRRGRHLTTPLIYAIENNRGAAATLLQSGAQLNIEFQDQYGGSALRYARQKGYAELVELIEQAINKGRWGGRKTKKRSINKKRKTKSKSQYKKKKGTRRR